MTLPEWQAMPKWQGAVKMADDCHSGRKLFLAEGISAHYRTVTIYPAVATVSSGFTERVHVEVTGPCKTGSAMRLACDIG